MSTEENNPNTNDLSKTIYPRFNTTTSDGRRNKSQEHIDLGRPKSNAGGILSSDHILYMELEGFK